MDLNSAVKILLVDDSEDNLMSMEIVLEKSGYTFFKARSGKEALKILLKEDDFTLILLDVKMPIMDGYETAELIYQRDKLKHIPIIFITGKDYEEDAVFKGYQTGAVDYIRKPVNPEVLRSKVAVFAELYKKNLLLQKQEEELRVINHDLMKLNQELENRVRERTLELEKLNEELKSLNLSKDKFLSVISHDLRNPLTALLTSSAKLNDDPEHLSNKQLKQLSGIILRTSKRILTQLNEVVEWAKEQHEKTNFNPQRIRLSKGIDDSLELVKPNALQKNIRIENKVATDIFLRADTFMLRSIIQNLVTNAIKFTPNGGSVKLTAQAGRDFVEIHVQDTGIGMSPELQEGLFSRTAAVNNGTNNELGTGLGLILVRDFVAQHSGSIVVESVLGKGTRFTVTIPYLEETLLASDAVDLIAGLPGDEI
ncbi:hybrid sensor histidine kinase/response regulator [Mucilaginibacter sp. RS28]|uniref:histidine kinase n=1 Tax=Mucilaginibacter straminoryzae TaxID=2932774 RepID=A0A9X2BCX2_9SPHI|nr:hybrid sensor histidine kinase/response regulator [Mucilaginibacter straminoryzae]MCJ8211457.1 hybrid sensor histidine kinase/response regulator [Mucilaginibacter straminoryzae]